MKLLITGANGLLGQKLTQLLQNDPSIDLSLTGRGPHRNSYSGSKYFDCDLTNPDAVKELFDWSNPEYVIHAAAMTQVDECELDQKACWNCNVNATKYLIREAKKIGAGFQYISTDFVFDGEKGDYSESDSTNPISFYGQSKLAAEQLVSISDLDWSIVRTVLVYGFIAKSSRSNLVLWVKNSLENSHPIKVVTDQIRTPTLVEDLAVGCSLILKHKVSGLFHLCGDEVLTPYEMAIETARHFNLNEKLISPVNASTFSQPGKRPPKTGLKIEKASSVLGFQPSSFQQGLTLVGEQFSGTNPLLFKILLN